MRPRIRFTVLLRALLLLVGVTGGCSDDGERSGSETTLTEPETEAGLFGTYSTELGELVLPAGAECSRPADECLPPPSKVSLRVSGSQLAIIPEGGDYPDQTISELSDPDVDEGTLVLAPSPLPCIVTTGPAGPGRYRWTVEDGTLRFITEEDTCVERALILTSSEWTRDS